MKFVQLNENNQKFSLMNRINSSCSCSEQECLTPEALTVPEVKPTYITGYIKTSSGSVQQVSTRLSPADRLQHVKARISSSRMTFSVKPGLYAVGNPSEDSDIVVTANYKMSFDLLRSALDGINAWIIVLDTGGINVWCAAGKGTFVTGELIKGYPLIIAGLLSVFTGATTFTNLSGVRRELKYALPVYITGAALSFIFLVLFKLSE